MLGYRRPGRVRRWPDHATTGKRRLAMPSDPSSALLLADPPPSRDPFAEHALRIFRLIGSPAYPTPRSGCASSLSPPTTGPATRPDSSASCTRSRLRRPEPQAAGGSRPYRRHPRSRGPAGAADLGPGAGASDPGARWFCSRAWATTFHPAVVADQLRAGREHAPQRSGRRGTGPGSGPQWLISATQTAGRGLDRGLRRDARRAAERVQRC